MSNALHFKSSYWIRQGIFDELQSFEELQARVNKIVAEKTGATSSKYSSKDISGLGRSRSPSNIGSSAISRYRYASNISCQKTLQVSMEYTRQSCRLSGQIPSEATAGAVVVETASKRFLCALCSKRVEGNRVRKGQERKLRCNRGMPLCRSSSTHSTRPPARAWS
jgi:hypothetical protein